MANDRTQRLAYQPVIVIGAARSGTKLMRDLIAEHPAVDRVPYDINYVWRIGNERVPHDELPLDLLIPRIRQRILKNFERYFSGAPFLVEKTVSNCLRVPFVYSVFPGVRFIHLVRDGRDVVESVFRQWIAPPDWRYILQKAMTFPVKEAFGYALSYAANTLRRFVARDRGRASSWGPRYDGIDQDVASKDLLEVCAIQWVRCVGKALSDLSDIPADQVFTIHYEELVQAPGEHLLKIAQFAGIDPAGYSGLSLEKVSEANIGKGMRNLSPEQVALIQPIIRESLSVLEYV